MKNMKRNCKKCNTILSDVDPHSVCKLCRQPDAEKFYCSQPCEACNVINTHQNLDRFLKNEAFEAILSGTQTHSLHKETNYTSRGTKSPAILANEKDTQCDSMRKRKLSSDSVSRESPGLSDPVFSTSSKLRSGPAHRFSKKRPSLRDRVRSASKPCYKEFSDSSQEELHLIKRTKRSSPIKRKIISSDSASNPDASDNISRDSGLSSNFTNVNTSASCTPELPLKKKRGRKKSDSSSKKQNFSSDILRKETENIPSGSNLKNSHKFTNNTISDDPYYMNFIERSLSKESGLSHQHYNYLPLENSSVAAPIRTPINQYYDDMPVQNMHNFPKNRSDIEPSKVDIHSLEERIMDKVMSAINKMPSTSPSEIMTKTNDDEKLSKNNENLIKNCESLKKNSDKKHTIQTMKLSAKEANCSDKEKDIVHETPIVLPKHGSLHDWIVSFFESFQPDALVNNKFFDNSTAMIKLSSTADDILLKDNGLGYTLEYNNSKCHIHLPYDLESLFSKDKKLTNLKLHPKVRQFHSLLYSKLDPTLPSEILDESFMLPEITPELKWQYFSARDQLLKLLIVFSMVDHVLTAENKKENNLQLFLQIIYKSLKGMLDRQVDIVNLTVQEIRKFLLSDADCKETNAINRLIIGPIHHSNFFGSYTSTLSNIIKIKGSSYRITKKANACIDVIKLPDKLTSSDSISVFVQSLKKYFEKKSALNEEKLSTLYILLPKNLLHNLEEHLKPCKLNDQNFEAVLDLLIYLDNDSGENTLQSKCEFYQTKQKFDQSVQSYCDNLKSLFEKGKFESSAKDILRDKFVSGLVDENVKQFLINKLIWNFDACLNYAKAEEKKINKSTGKNSQTISKEIKVKEVPKNTKERSESPATRKKAVKEIPKFTKERSKSPLTRKKRVKEVLKCTKERSKSPLTRKKTVKEVPKFTKERCKLPIKERKAVVNRPTENSIKLSTVPILVKNKKQIVKKRKKKIAVTNVISSECESIDEEEIKVIETTTRFLDVSNLSKWNKYFSPNETYGFSIYCPWTGQVLRQ